MSSSPQRAGAVAIIAFCFLGSGAMRLTEHGSAFAEGISEALEARNNAHAAPEAAEPVEEADVLLSAIRDREKQLETEADNLSTRAQELSVAEKKLEEQLTAFRKAQEQLENTLAMADGAAERDIAQMTTVYEAMKPEEAARIFERMEISFAAGIMSRMRPEITADVLTAMEPDTAYAVTLTIASRNSGVPTE
ncbi:MotE family protein [Amaricoccus tamworthensis]|uniref:MotE family protein n=1 Tax=Amaricoccus tamworthensis TaxID=57002 RepID=UPI003C7E2D2C